MPSLRQKVTTYFRQLSFIAEPRSESPRGARKPSHDGEDNFIVKYLQGRIDRQFIGPGPEIFTGQNPTDLPTLKIDEYPIGPTTITAACTGPDEGLTGIKRSKLHLSASYADDIDFIDTTQEDNDCFEVRKSINSNSGHNNQNKLKTRKSISNIATNDQNANKPTTGMRSRKNSRSSISNLKQQQSTHGGGSCKDTVRDSNATTSTAMKTATKNPESKKSPLKATENANVSTTIVVSMVSTKYIANDAAAIDQNNKNVVNTDPGRREDRDRDGDGATKKSWGLSVNTDTRAGKDCEKLDNATPKAVVLENTREQLLHEAIANQMADVKNSKDMDNSRFRALEVIAGVTDWRMETDYAYGISVSLYENNMLTKEPMGSPIADCYGIVVRGDAAALALADGVNWGDGARLAARSAVHGCLDYLDRAIFGLASECMARTTSEVYVSLLRSLWEGHGCILEVGGSLSTLTIAVVLPLARQDDNKGEEDENDVPLKYVVCACNVGDSLGYVYSKKYGVREFTQASHDITSMRDMRDALGALGPADGNKPELSNLTFSMTIVESGDIVFLTSDGISDNFDPVVGKFAEAWTTDVKLMASKSAQPQQHLAPKRQNKSASSIYARLQHPPQNRGREIASQSTSSAAVHTSTKNLPSSGVKTAGAPAALTAPSRPKYMRSQTVIEPTGRPPAISRGLSVATETSHTPNPTHLSKVPKSLAGLPLVTGPQRHALTLYRLEDLLSYGINGTFSPCTSARRLCHLLIDFARMITSARRKTLEQRELFYKLANGPDGIKREVELNRIQHRVARKRVIDSATFAALPGKLDHATVVAYTVGIGAGQRSSEQEESGRREIGAQVSVACAPSSTSNAAALFQSKNFNETNF